MSRASVAGDLQHGWAAYPFNRWSDLKQFQFWFGNSSQPSAPEATIFYLPPVCYDHLSLVSDSLIRHPVLFQLWKQTKNADICTNYIILVLDLLTKCRLSCSAYEWVHGTLPSPCKDKSAHMIGSTNLRACKRQWVASSHTGTGIFKFKIYSANIISC